jgi:hypothetical protein
MKELAAASQLEGYAKTRVLAFIGSAFNNTWKFASEEIVDETAEQMIGMVREGELNDREERDLVNGINMARQFYKSHSIRPQFILES